MTDGLNECKNITQKLINMPIFEEFTKPNLDPEFLKKYSYHPDLKLILEKLNSNQYPSVEKWFEDIKIIWKNTYRFYKKDSLFGGIALEGERISTKMYESMAPTNRDKAVNKCGRTIKKLRYLFNTLPPSLSFISSLDQGYSEADTREMNDNDFQKIINLTETASPETQLQLHQILQYFKIPQNIVNNENVISLDTIPEECKIYLRWFFNQKQSETKTI